MSPPGKKCGVTTKLSVENASRSPGAGAGSTAASSPRSSSSPAYAAKNTSSMMRFIIVPPLPCPNMTVVSITLLAFDSCERMFHVKHRTSCKVGEGSRGARDLPCFAAGRALHERASEQRMRSGITRSRSVDPLRWLSGRRNALPIYIVPWS